ncbi:ABC transporter permease subunit [Pararoseomonas sp. SCSIO 73927]|uniref:ABC transporter permease n=1 Tax=Pararoseomonas sp. SCSIO 73927 TaxID=3114537 RepID=UPI0030D3E54C
MSASVGTGVLPAAREAGPWRIWAGGAGAGLAWLAAAAVVLAWPDMDEYGRTGLLGGIAASVGLALLLAGLAGAPGPAARLRPAGPWLVALAAGLIAWELVTAKLDLLPRPFFVAPQALLEVFTDDYAKLGESVLHSLLLLIPGYLLGAAIGFTVGVAMGWSRRVGYWAHPVLRLIGPLPATAWLPIAFFAFSTSRQASTFLIALATFFPVAVLTWSGVASVAGSFYDVARTMGARPWFLIRKVAVPAALPSVFVGLFMGLGSSFSVLVVAEMMGVKAGLGFYMQWSQGWAAYANVYAALLVLAGMCTGLVTLLFRVRDWKLAWQKGVVRW